jgi:hypothetical protein
VQKNICDIARIRYDWDQTKYEIGKWIYSHSFHSHLGDLQILVQWKELFNFEISFVPLDFVDVLDAFTIKNKIFLQKRHTEVYRRWNKFWRNLRRFCTK